MRENPEVFKKRSKSQLQYMALNWIMIQKNCKMVKDNQENLNTGLDI